MRRVIIRQTIEIYQGDAPMQISVSPDGQVTVSSDQTPLLTFRSQEPMLQMRQIPCREIRLLESKPSE